MTQDAVPSNYGSNRLRKRHWQPDRLLLNSMAILLAVLALWPLIGLIREALQGFINGSASLGVDGPQQIQGT